MEVLSALSNLGRLFVDLGVPLFFLLILDKSLFEFLLFLLLSILFISRLVFEELIEVTILFLAVGLGLESAFLHFGLLQGFLHHPRFLLFVFHCLSDAGVELIH